MNNTNQNHTDNFFKQGLESPPEFKPSDKNWKEMERLLKPGAKMRGMAWIYPVSGIAAALLVFLSLWLTTDQADPENQKPQIAKALDKVNETESQKNSSPGSVKPGNIDASSAGSFSDVITKVKLESRRRTVLLNRNDREIKSNQSSSHQTDLFTANQHTVGTFGDAGYASIQTSSTSRFASELHIEKPTALSNVVKAGETKTKSPDIETSIVSGKWALSLALSPDINSVKRIDNGDMGMSMGLGVSYRLGKTLSIGTGIYYSKKLYSADKASYKATEKPFVTWASYSKQIDADCRVIDVPLNLSLRLSNKTQNKLYATAGMSSYIMLSEKYDFVYNNPSPAYPTGHREYTVHNENKHLLSVVNLGLALERPLSDQVSVVVQPYAKLPLTGIGQGETDLKSFGLGLKLNYSLKKKKEFGYNRKISTPVAKQE